MKLSVVILNWNGRRHLERYLPSVVEHTSGDAEVIVADNGSTDDSLQWLRLNYPDVGVIRLDRNYGFAGGYNRALKEVDSEYVLLLNSDVEVTAGWWQPLVDVLKVTCLKVNAYPATCYTGVGICALVVNANYVTAKVGNDL